MRAALALDHEVDPDDASSSLDAALGPIIELFDCPCSTICTARRIGCDAARLHFRRARIAIDAVANRSLKDAHTDGDSAAMLAVDSITDSLGFAYIDDPSVDAACKPLPLWIGAAIAYASRFSAFKTDAVVTMLDELEEAYPQITTFKALKMNPRNGGDHPIDPAEEYSSY